MPRYEYKVVPAPNKGLKGKDVKGAEARFSHALQELMNGLSGYGWEYQRAETLPSIERAGLTGTTTEWRNVLVFRRPRDSDAEAFSPERLPAPKAFQDDAVVVTKAATAPIGPGSAGDLDADTNAADLNTAPAAASTTSPRGKKSDGKDAATAPKDAPQTEATKDTPPEQDAEEPTDGVPPLVKPTE
ncbi:hypothetical protein [Roseobacter sp. GAI101]|uniref:hypothetical protein n=1 Tax=Roseobacter sp. (strain GAI101) TaxID=391589 RepID=UPI00030A0226|nr:hypothetical protein [Roseobacter sp. GAI101]